jgi:hypothetical protein
MAGINKLTKISTAEGGVIGVANCASFGKCKTTVYNAANSSAPLGSGTRLMDYMVIADRS